MVDSVIATSCGFITIFLLAFLWPCFSLLPLIWLMWIHGKTAAQEKSHKAKASFRGPVRLDDYYYAVEDFAFALKIWNIHYTYNYSKVSGIVRSLKMLSIMFHFWWCGTFQRFVFPRVRNDWKPFTSIQYPAQKACLCNMSTWQNCHHSTRHQCFPAIQV